MKEEAYGCTVLFAVFGLALIPPVSGFGQTKRGSFDGVWQAMEVTVAGPAGPTTFKLGPNLTLFSGRHYGRIDVQTDTPRPVLENPNSATVDELRQVWGPLVAEAGTYESTENQITLHPIVAKNPAVIATKRHSRLFIQIGRRHIDANC